MAKILGLMIPYIPHHQELFYEWLNTPPFPADYSIDIYWVWWFHISQTIREYSMNGWIPHHILRSILLIYIGFDDSIYPTPSGSILWMVEYPTISWGVFYRPHGVLCLASTHNIYPHYFIQCLRNLFCFVLLIFVGIKNKSQKLQWIYVFLCLCNFWLFKIPLLSVSRQFLVKRNKIWFFFKITAHYAD